MDYTSYTKRNRRKRVRSLVFTFAIAMTILAALLIAGFLAERQANKQASLDRAESQIRASIDEINAAFEEVVSTATKLAEDIQRGRIPYNAVEEAITGILEEHSRMDGVAVTYTPFAYEPDLRLYQTYRYRQPDRSIATLDGATYDYSAPPGNADGPNTGWYHTPLEVGPTWLPPFFATGAQKTLIEYGLPFYKDDAAFEAGTPTGVITLDYSLEDVRYLIDTLELGATGYGYMFNETGQLLVHPVQDLVLNRTVQQLAEAAGDQSLLDGITRVQSSETTTIETIDPVSGDPSWTLLVPISAPGWGIGVVINQTEFDLPLQERLQQVTLISIVVALALLGWIALAFQIEGFSPAEMWVLAIAFSLLALAIIGVIWMITYVDTSTPSVALTSNTIVERYLQTYDNSSLDQTRPLDIPTGIEMTALEFGSPTTVTINGFIWQRIPNEFIELIIPGVRMSNLTGAEFTLSEVQRVENGNSTTILWEFGAEFRQRFDTSQYPFERRNIQLRMLPADFDTRIVLRPDLPSYALIKPALLPGVDEMVSVSSWQFLGSQFFYRDASLGTNFGVEAQPPSSRAPELVFKLDARRDFLGPFIAYLLPALIAAAMLFAFLLNERSDNASDEIMSVLNYSAALFFVIAVIHTSLRDSIAAVGITYLEYAYIFLYLSIIYVALNTFIRVKRPDWWLVAYENNLISKLVYWPLVTGSLLVVTMQVFVW
jgi:hypothetical protein